MPVIKTLIVDDNVPFRKLLRTFLSSEPDIEVVGEANDGENVLDQIKKFKPDVVLMDVSMKRIGGIMATRQLKNAQLELKIIMLSVYDLDEYRQAAEALGACDYILKKNMIKELVPAIHAAFANPDDSIQPGKSQDDEVCGAG